MKSPNPLNNTNPALLYHQIRNHNSLNLHPNSTALSDSSSRKKDHIALAFESQTAAIVNDKRFFYEPMASGHHTEMPAFSFLGKRLSLPLWISSMTGGTALAGMINRNLAQACSEFGLGMGLGSCRRLLTDNAYFEDFNMRPIIGNDLPFYANLGIAQVETLIAEKATDKIAALITKLQADGLIVHVNPMQEWLQPEGDRFQLPPLETIQNLLELLPFPVIVKEVGQGMGPESVKALLKLPLAAFDFGAYGGTNFSKLELLRSDEERSTLFENLSYIGHTAEEMTAFVNDAIASLGNKRLCNEVIISGGIRNFLDGYYHMQCLPLNSIYAQGSAFLKYAQVSYPALKTYIESQRDGLALCRAYLKIRK